MKYSFAAKRMVNFEKQRDVLLILSGVLLICVTLLSIKILFQDEKVITLPPEVRREFWAEGNKFSPEYLEEQAAYMLYLALDVNKATLPYNTEILMRYADAESSETLKMRFERHMKKLSQNDAWTQFEIKEMKVYPDNNLVHATGRMKTFMVQKQISDEEEEYEVRFKTFRGRLFLSEIAKVSETNKG